MKILSLATTAIITLTFTTGMALATYHNKPTASGGVKVQVGKAGGQLFLMDGDKMTLYIFDRDGRNVSNCAGGCAAKWPPFVAATGTALPAGYSLIARADGSKQIAYHQKPLYFWISDAKPGDMKGDGVGGVWHVARP